MFGNRRSGTQPSETDRFGVRVEGDGTWTVFDVFTGWPADYVGRSLDGLEKGLADSLCAVLWTSTAAGRRAAEAVLSSSISGAKHPSDCLSIL
ncbi:hypothetical protein ELI02_33850 [Rhizobium leguminosarum]|uniref:Uncharacterized protein n=1 Tax=Rhizobium leguminosarum TaxID=384 RepID=A0A4Q8XNS1_RHILE|nr:hypothetical protein [Rhizobium leguminosarum]TAX22740.1 hypothetical protein ELI04_32560 [Rhizobium leguminosarum]TAX43384.1 hypothetical protein ELI02_33850 [Rhizobium leguminosarum]TAX46531.1 hypothetical protein ELI01_30585 [Rhizobium leguminosarum]TAX64430.1 hypothetical protein ELI03_34835 [Rhizobium leguminosarum]TAY05761.1 hypothetical protein ELH91_30480 [Rhizobium leguminosarum]